MNVSARPHLSDAHDLLAHAPVLAHRSGGIDAARGFFALWVLLTHLIPFTVWSQGEGAVPRWLADVFVGMGKVLQPSAELHPAVVGFVVLSGYCIHRNGFRGDQADLRAFAIKRFFRIIPVYLLATLTGLLAFSIAVGMNQPVANLLSGTYAIRPVCVAAKVLLVASLVPNFHVCAFIGNAPLATVMVEITLYITYALAFALLVARGRSSLVVQLAVASWLAGLVVAFLQPYLTHLYNWWQNGSLLGLLPYWWLGALCVHPGFVASLRRNMWLWVTIWLATTAFILAGSPALAALGEVRKLAFCGLAGIAMARIDASNISASNPVSVLGRSGYSLYAFHAPITYLLCLAGISWWLNGLVNLAMAGVFYRLIERPFTSYGRRLARAPG